MKEIAEVLLAAVLVGGVWAAVAVRVSGERTQPVAYNHKKHIEAGLECAGCHAGIAEGRPRAGLPNVDLCVSCHGEGDENPKTRPIREFAARNELIGWQQVYRVPDHVLFSHRRHVGAGKLDCALCHGDMASKETPVTRQAVPIRMDGCMDCHRRSGVTNDCLSCHR